MTARPEGLTAGTWNLDATHTDVAFTVRHAGISKVRGHFGEVEGTLTVGESLEDLAFAATISTGSVSTGNKDRDGHLVSPDFFDAEQFPTLSFTSTAVTPEAITGDLTLHGVTRSVELEWDYEGAATDPFGNYRSGFTASTKISRKDFGLTWNAALEAGGVLVSDEVKISIETEFTAPATAAA
jgi:polyisoprenoid-binding protein YceI